MDTTSHSNKAVLIISVLASILLAFTDFYGIGYLISVTIPTLVFGSFFVFRTYTQRFVLFLLTILAVTPIVGLVCSMLHTELMPVYNIVAFFAVCGLLYTRKSVSAKLNFIDKADITAIIVAAIPIVIMTLSYATAPNLRASLFQFASEGWDNGSHIVMIEDISLLHGYAYNNYPGSKQGFTGGPSSYPQAWHLATADIVNGFGGVRFDDAKPFSTLIAYVAASVGWTVLTSYLIVLCVWRSREHFFGKFRATIKDIVPIVSITLALGLVVIIPSLMHGFTNYIGTIAYIVLLSAMLIESRINKNHYIYVLAALFGTMSVLTWFLTLPAAGLVILFMYFTRSNKLKTSLTQIIKDWRIVIVLVGGVVAMATQVLIFQNATAGSGGATNQLNAGVRVFPFDMTDGGPLQISPILFGLLTAIVIMFITLRKNSVKIKETLLILVVPWLFLALVVYFYQNITEGSNSYYLPKVIGLSLVATILPLGALFSAYLSNLKFTYPRLTISTLAVIIPCLVIIGTGQPPFGIIKLFQAHARTTYSTAATIVPYFKDADVIDGKSTIVVVSSRTNYENIREDNHGKLEIRLFNNTRNCTYGVTKYRPMEMQLSRLASCADKLAKKDKDIIAVISPDLKNKIAALEKSNIHVVIAP